MSQIIFRMSADSRKNTWYADARTALVCPCLVVSCLSLSGIVLLPRLYDLSVFKGNQKESIVRRSGQVRQDLLLCMFCSLWRGLPVRLCPSCITVNGACACHISSQALGCVMLCCVSCRGSGRERAVPIYCTLSIGVGGVTKTFSLQSGEILPKYITCHVRLVQACLDPPPAAFGDASLSVRVRRRMLSSVHLAVNSAVNRESTRNVI